MRIVEGKDRIDDIRMLVKEYTDWIGLDLSFQNLEDELADPAAKYTPPKGELLLALAGYKDSQPVEVQQETQAEGVQQQAQPAGMVAYTKHSEERCEMKRLYVRPAFRGEGVGRKLAGEIIERARAAGYKEMVLDNLSFMEDAYRMYEMFGFRECEPYYDNPIPGTRYMKLVFDDQGK